jgi:hypothetical protein
MQCQGDEVLEHDEYVTRLRKLEHISSCKDRICHKK